MPVQQVKNVLDTYGISYECIKHATVYTAQEIAAATHIPGRELAKTVMIKAGGKMIMAVLPASQRVDFGLLKEVLGARMVELAREQEFKDMFPGCTVGAMPPFGNLYGVDVYVEETLTTDERITFNAGSHTEVMRIAYKDFARLVNPKVAKFARPIAAGNRPACGSMPRENSTWPEIKPT